MNSRETGSPADMSMEERARLVVALDHDVRQPQHSIEMGLRRLRLVIADLTARRFDDGTLDALLENLRCEVDSVQAAHRQVVDAHRDMIDALLFASQDRALQPQVVRADELIDRLCKSNRSISGNIELRGARSRLTFFSDERCVERIITNLIANAMRHSRATKVLLGARRRDGDIVFEVRDNGTGIAASKLAAVFDSDPALSVSAFTKIASGASGLGLYIVRLFADRLGGSVKCPSVSGRGSLFQVRLPGPLGSSERVHRVPNEAAFASARNKLVAILDDDLDALRTGRRLFGALGIETYGDHDPLRWLSVVTDLKRVPDLFLLAFDLKAQDCSLQLDIVQRKWGKERTKVLLMAGASTSVSLAKVATTVPVLLKPLTEAKFKLILEFLAGIRPLPASGFVEVGE